jgi:hypothetical protein
MLMNKPLFSELQRGAGCWVVHGAGWLAELTIAYLRPVGTTSVSGLITTSVILVIFVCSLNA